LPIHEDRGMNRTAPTRRRKVFVREMLNQPSNTTEKAAGVAEAGAHVAPDKATARKAPGRKKDVPQSQKRAQAGQSSSKRAQKRKGEGGPAQPEVRPGTAKAKVISLLGRTGGASLEEICNKTEWQPHTVRGFISLLGTKNGYVITSSRREGEERLGGECEAERAA